MIWQDKNGVRHEDCTVFFKVKEEFGELSNMHNGSPLRVNEKWWGSSEALYQACRYPAHPAIQQEIFEARHAMEAKMKSKKGGRRERLSRPDWDAVRVDIMRWCLAVKLACNFRAFRDALQSTGQRPIVERSRKDDFWGAQVRGQELVGQNVLGQLLMELRRRSRTHPTRISGSFSRWPFQISICSTSQSRSLIGGLGRQWPVNPGARVAGHRPGPG